MLLTKKQLTAVLVNPQDKWQRSQLFE